MILINFLYLNELMKNERLHYSTIVILDTNQTQVKKKLPDYRFTCWIIFLQVVAEAVRRKINNCISHLDNII